MESRVRNPFVGLGWTCRVLWILWHYGVWLQCWDHYLWPCQRLLYMFLEMFHQLPLWVLSRYLAWWPSSSSQCQPCYIDQIENILNFLCTETNSCTWLGLVCIGALVRLFQKLKYRNPKWSHRAELVGSKA